MKILHYINNLGSGGAEKLLSDILPLMKEKGYEVELMIANSKANVEKFEKIVQGSGIKIINLNTSFYNPLQIFKVLKYIKKNKIDIVHAHLFPTQYWLAFASLFLNSKVKLIKTEHSVYNERKEYEILKPIERFVYKRYVKIIGITEEVKLNLANWLKEDSENKINIIHNGVNLSQIRNEQESIDNSQYKFIDFEFYNILMVGRFDGWQKDQKTLVKSLALLPNHFRVIFVGQGDAMDDVIQSAEFEGVKNRVTFLGLRQDVYKLMNLVDLNVLSTNHEGLSGVVLESLASKKPFLGSKVVGVKEIVPDDRFLFTKGDEKELAEKISKIANDKEYESSLIKASLSYVEQFDINHMVNGYLKLYEEIN